MLNKVMLIGRLGRDPELRYTQGGQAVANFSVATSEHWKDDKGERQERTEWHRVVVWGKQAEFCSNFLTKGRQVYIEGRLQTREWEDRDSNKRQTTEIVVTNIQALGSKPGGEAAEREYRTGREGPAARAALDKAQGQQAPPDDDIPF